MQPEQRTPFRFHKGPFAHRTAQTSVFLRVYPNSLRFSTVWASHQLCIQPWFCHKLQFHEGASFVIDESSHATKILPHLEALSLLNPRYFVVLPLCPRITRNGRRGDHRPGWQTCRPVDRFRRKTIGAYTWQRTGSGFGFTRFQCLSAVRDSGRIRDICMKRRLSCVYFGSGSVSQPGTSLSLK